MQRSGIELRDLVARAAEEFRSSLSERGVAFRTVLPEAEVWADADPTRTNKVITNLLHYGGRGVKLIALSGYARAEDVRRAIEAGFDAHLAKPADPQQLARLLA